MGGKTSQSQSTVTIPPEVMARYNAVNARAEEVAKQPFQPYQGQFVAGLTAPQQAGIAQTQKYAETAQPYFREAADLTRAGSGDVGTLTPGQIQRYQDPYTKAVADTTYQALRQQQQQDMAGQTANAIRSGAFGGDRSGLAAANLARQQTLGTAQAMAPIYSQGYQQAVQTAQGQQNVQAADLARKLQSGQQIAGLGTGAQQAGMQGAQAQIGAGTVEQQTQQADLTARYQQFLQERGYPFQVAQFLANIAMGTGALSGSTTTTTQPSSFFSDRELKHDVKEIGQTNDGLPIYSFKYNGDNRTQIGLMAQDVEKKHPEAVGLAAGYKTVDYKKATEDSERSEKAYGGGLVPTTISMGGAVTEPGNYASGGSIVDSDDLSSILAAQRQMFAPFGQAGLYGGQGAGTPGASKPGYVPAATLPVAKLVTAQTPSQRSGQTGLGEIMSGVEKAQGFGEALLGEKGLFGEKGAGARAVQLAKKTVGKEEPKPNAPKGGQTPAPKDGSTPKTDATNTSSQKISSLEYPDRDEILRRLMDRDSVAAKNGGAIGRTHKMWGGPLLDQMGVDASRAGDFGQDAAWAMILGTKMPNPKDYGEGTVSSGGVGGGMPINPASLLTSKIPTAKAKNGGAIGRIGYAGLGKVIDPMELQDPSKGINAYIEDAAEEQEDTSDDKIAGAGNTAGGGGGKGKSGASTALGIAGTLANFIPGVGPAVGAGLKAASMLFNEGGVVPREAYQQGGTQPSYDDMIRQAADREGVPYEIARAIAQSESSMDAKAKAKTSTAGGIYQITDRTLKGLGGDPSLKYDPEHNIQHGVKYVGQNYRSLTSPDDPDAPAKTMLGHFFGTSGAKNVLGAPDRPISETLSNYKAAVAANYGVKSPSGVPIAEWTGQDAQEWARAKMAKALGVAGAQARAQTGDTSDVQASAQRKGVAPQGEERSALYDYLPTRKNEQGEESLDWRKILIPTLTGLGAMASSPSRYLGSAVLQGLGAGAQSFANLEEKMANIAATEMGTKERQAEIVKGSFYTDSEGRGFVRYYRPDGTFDVMLFTDWLDLPEDKKPALDPTSYAKAMQYMQTKGIKKSDTGTTATGVGGGTTPASTGTGVAPKTEAPAAPVTTTQTATTEPTTKPVEPTVKPAGAKPTEETAPAGPAIQITPQMKQEAVKTARQLMGAGKTATATQPGLKIFENQRDLADGAQNMRLQIATLGSTLSGLPRDGSILTSGKAQEVLQPIAAIMNNFLAAAKMPEVVSASDLASSESVKKTVRMMADAAARSGNHSSYAALTALAETVPNITNSPGGQAKLLAELYIINQMQIDKANYMNQIYEAAKGQKGQYIGQAPVVAGLLAPKFSEKNNSAFYNKERENLVKMFNEGPAGAIGPNGRQQSWIEWINSNAKTMDAEQIKNVEKLFGRGIVRYFGIGG